MWPNRQETVNLVTFTEEILNGKLHFLCSDWNLRQIKVKINQLEILMILTIMMIIGIMILIYGDHYHNRKYMWW